MKQRRRAGGRKPYAGGRRRRRSRRRLGRGSAARRTVRARRCGSPGAGARLLPANAPLVQGSLPPGMEAAGGSAGGARRGAARRRPGLSYHPHIPGPILPPGTRLLHLTDDPRRSGQSRGRFFHRRRRTGGVWSGWPELVPDADRPGPSPRPAPGAPPPTEPMSVGYVFRALASALPEDAVVVEESVSSRAAFYDQIRIERTSSYFATGGIGLYSPYRPRSASDWPGRARRGLHRRRWVDDVRRPCHLDTVALRFPK